MAPGFVQTESPAGEIHGNQPVILVRPVPIPVTEKPGLRLAGPFLQAFIMISEHALRRPVDMDPGVGQLRRAHGGACFRKAAVGPAGQCLTLTATIEIDPVGPVCHGAQVLDPIGWQVRLKHAPRGLRGHPLQDGRVRDGLPAPDRHLAAQHRKAFGRSKGQRGVQATERQGLLKPVGARCELQPHSLARVGLHVGLDVFRSGPGRAPGLFLRTGCGIVAGRGDMEHDGHRLGRHEGCGKKDRK